MKLWDKLKNRSQTAAQTVDRYQEASVYAQAGGLDQARGMLSTDHTEAPVQGTLLVLVQGTEFPEEMRSYALNMAQRLGHKIQALNTAPIKRETWMFLDLEQQQIRRDFHSRADAEFAKFKQEADQIGVFIDHKVKFMDKEEALEEMQRTVPHIEFVISNAEPVQTPNSKQAERPRAVDGICVYSLA